MMTNDELERQERQAFDKWFDDEHKHLESSNFTNIVPHIKYVFWQAWQARANLEKSDG